MHTIHSFMHRASHAQVVSFLTRMLCLCSPVLKDKREMGENVFSSK